MGAAVVPLVVGSTALNVLSARQEAKAASAASVYNATIAEQNATLAKQNAEIQEEEARLEARRNLGAATARAAAGGGAIEGSVVDALASQAMFDELSALTVRHRGELEALGFTNTAKLDRANAKNAKTQGKINMASAILSGGAQMTALKRG
ncbi:MAG: hypothetical protein C4542_06100 [Dehalococcoidia bacterium]|nr:MAG: hypothetical protein C4542_06100 [Dehalococcoidia bacterium]